mgnify:FL=1
MQTPKSQNENNQQLFGWCVKLWKEKFMKHIACIINNSMPQKEDGINSMLLWLNFKNSRNFKTIRNEWMVGTQDNPCIWCIAKSSSCSHHIHAYFVFLWLYVLEIQNGHKIVIHNVRFHPFHINACILFSNKNSSNDKHSFQLSIILVHLIW